MDKLLHELIEGLLTFLAALVPPALGAIVSLLYETGLTWAQRATQLWVGVVVSYFIQRAAGALYPFHPFVLQAVGFILGMIAFKATPGFISGCSTVAAELPALLRDRVLALLPRKDKK
jgi:hypothetical protein